MQGARRFCDEGIVDTMSRSEIAAQRSRQAAIRRLAAKVCEKCGPERLEPMLVELANAQE